MLLYHILLISAFQKESPLLTPRSLRKHESKGVSYLPVMGDKGSFMKAKKLTYNFILQNLTENIFCRNSAACIPLQL